MFRKIIVPLIILSFILTPIISLAAGVVPESCQAGACTMCDLVTLIKNILTFIFQLSFSLATAAVFYGGVLMLLYGGTNPTKLEKSKEVILNAVIGVTITLTAWLVVNTIYTFFFAAGSTWNVLDCAKLLMQ